MITFGPSCIKLTISGNLAISGNYHGNKASQPISIEGSMAVTIDSRIDGKFMQRGPNDQCHDNECMYPLQDCILVRKFLYHNPRKYLCVTVLMSRV